MSTKCTELLNETLMSTKTMNQVIANYFKTQEDCTFGI